MSDQDTRYSTPFSAQATEETGHPDKPRQTWSGEDHRPTNNEFISPIQAEHIYNLSRSMLAKARHLGTGPPFFKANRQIRYRRSDIESWLGPPRQKTRDGGAT